MNIATQLEKIESLFLQYKKEIQNFILGSREISVAQENIVQEVKEQAEKKKLLDTYKKISSIKK
ncbi:MAG: hypothetical protein V1848_00600 [Candidatus Magasanikbacteria bacterium]